MTVINSTIGTDARNYETMTLWEADDGGGDGLGNDDCTGSCYKDSPFDESVTIDFSANSIVLTVAEGERHHGTAGSGARIVGSTRKVTLGASGASCNWLEIDSGGGRTDLGSLEFVTGISGLSCSHLIVHNAWCWAGGTGIHTSGFHDVNICNCLVYDCQVRISSGGGIGHGIWNVLNVYNCTVHDITSYDNPGSRSVFCYIFADTAGQKLQNCIGTDSEDGDYDVTSYDNATVDHNLSSDDTASGDGSLINKAAADQFISTSPVVLLLKLGANAINAGVDLEQTPSGVQFDILNRDRHTKGDVWDMGAHEFTSELPVTGTLNPDVTGTYLEVDSFGGKPYYKLAGEEWFIWWDGVDTWVISSVVGTEGAAYWTQTDPDVTGEYDFEGTATGIATVGEPVAVGNPWYYYAQQEAAA